MKASEIRDLGSDEIQQKVADMKETLFNLRFQHEIGQLENPKKITQTKKDIARLNTILNEKLKPSKEN
ncbi:50S ribosomal protein L29 [Desulfosarcina ovata subsp. sediminis]|uniref:Large ribosomal subunit protein uL29 n=1 Tax=Desulfosarcina ovata subsp. sediminis TaxID=885957 RepID=A0A5K7ZZM0_9BACT|nr:50S ribosomal protein L29 [Desulfosarcina ovata]BBO85550.1 50S ribosomal protein L29 [Desulfosarcina ovata subsp. sediminis]